MRAICSTIGGDDASNADVEDEAEEHKWERTQKDESECAEEEAKEASEIEVSAHELY